MKILHIVAAYKPAYIYGGPTMSVALLCENLVAAGNDVEVFTTTANGVNELPVVPNKSTLVDGVIVTYFKRSTKDHTHFSPALLKAVGSRAKEFDAIHIHTWWNLVSVLSCLIAVIKKVPVIVSPRGMLSKYSFSTNNTGFKSILHKMLGKALLQKSNIHVTSLKELDAVTKLIKPVSITNIPNFVKLPNLPLQYAPSKQLPLKLLFLSRIEEKKGLDILLAALSMISTSYHLTIAGDGKKDYIDSLKVYISNHHLSPHVTWIGFVGDDKFDILQQHDLMVLPSYDENFGNVVIESLSVGTAVLISENVGLADYVLANDCGWVCKATPKSLREALNYIALFGNDKLTAINKTAPQLVRNDFTGSKLADDYMNLYQNIAS